MAKRAPAKRSATDPAADVVDTFTGGWILLLITGILWLLLGFMVLSYRVSSVSIVVVLIAIVFAMGAVSCFALAALTQGGWRVFGIVAGIVALLAAVGALVWPSPTVLIVSVFVAWYLLIRGIFDVVISLSHTDVGGWWLLLISGIISFALGAWAIGNPDRSVLLLLTIIGVFAIFHGVAELITAFRLRSARKELGLS
jgi:uncharacterized membrane protein HdeD (DUF308 family)